MNRLPDLSDGDLSTLTNALLVAAEKYEANAQHFRDIKPGLLKEEADPKNLGKVRLVHSSICDPMAEQFDKQAVATRALMERLEEESVDA